tara:strand:+ start:27 stop:335 length:309 start_codon:yes stop_codon:yes gene_type:complete
MKKEQLIKDKLHFQIYSEVLERLLLHFRKRTDVQNIDLMNLSGFCRNCLSKWYVSAAEKKGIEINYEEAREIIYGMPYSEWKNKYQTEATKEQMDRWNKSKS